MLGLILLGVGTVVFAMSFSVIQKLIFIGEGNLVDGRNPISFCNVLFAGNLVAALTFAGIFHSDFRFGELRKVSFRQWLLLTITAILEGVIGPLLIFRALEEISVASVVLVQSIQIPLLLLVGWLFYREIPNRHSMIGALLAMGGVILMIVLKAFSEMQSSTNLSFGSSEVKVLIASLAFVVATQLRRRFSGELPLGLYPLVRAIVGGIVFALIVMLLFGPSHFMDVTSPFLWKWMLIYGALIVAVGQLTWQFGLRFVRSCDICIAESALPVLGLGFAFLFLGQFPSSSEWIGGLVILLGVGLALRGKIVGGQPGNSLDQATRTKECRGSRGFTGV